MKGAHQVRMRIIEVKKTCPRGHTAGEEWVIDGVTPDGICLGSFSSCMPYLTALRYGASFPWERRRGRSPSVARITSTRWCGGSTAWGRTRQWKGSDQPHQRSLDCTATPSGHNWWVGGANRYQLNPDENDDEGTYQNQDSPIHEVLPGHGSRVPIPPTANCRSDPA